MAVLSAKARKNLSDSTFAGPGRTYPIPDKAHAANAKARSSQAVSAGRMSASTKAQIDAAANRVLQQGFTGKLKSRRKKQGGQTA